MFRSRVGLVVCYHRVGDPAGDPTAELVPSIGIRLLRQQLAHLRGAYHVVALAQLRTAAEMRRRGSCFPLAITFDDDLASHAAVAVPELSKSALPATFFLSGASSLHAPFCFWWEDLQRAVNNGQIVELRQLTGRLSTIGTSNIHQAAVSIELLPPPQRDAVAAKLRDVAGMPPVTAGVRAADVEMIARSGFEVGFHTRGHYVLNTLDDQQLEQELRNGREELERLTDEPIRVLA